MLIDVKVPVFSESVAEGTIAQWHKHQGDYVRREESLADLETDKVMLEIAAPDAGQIKEIKRPEGSTVQSNEVVAMIDTAAQAPASGHQGGGQQTDAVTEAPAAAQQAEGPAAQQVSAQQGPDQPAAGSDEAAQAAVGVSPAARKLAEEHRLDPARIAGSGKGGRVTKGDVLKHVEAGEQDKQGAEAPLAGARPEQRVPMTRLRARIAERLLEAQQTTAMLTTFNEIDMQPVMDLRKRYQERFQKQHGIKLGVMSFFIKACIEGLKRLPVINASVDGKDIIYHGYFDIGIAVSTPRGLVVPIVRDADQRSFAELEHAVADYGTRARDGKLELDELSGGTFSITNGGIFGSMLSTPILNPPQSAILGMHKIQERPVAVDGQVVVRPVMYVALSYDHRIIDGAEAVQFLVSVKESIEDPARVLLQI